LVILDTVKAMIPVFPVIALDKPIYGYTTQVTAVLDANINTAPSGVTGLPGG
jgi:hypothetical protein